MNGKLKFRLILPLFFIIGLINSVFAISGFQKKDILQSMNSFLATLNNNESWSNLVPYIDFPDAGVPDCGMFIESYTSHVLMINGNKASVRVRFLVAGEFAGTNYYLYPKTIERFITYNLIYTKRQWSTTEESGITNYEPVYDDDSSRKVRTIQIAFMNVKYMDWHMRYYDPHIPNRAKKIFPVKHCWE